MTHRLATNYAKNYCNRTPIVKVIVENVVTCFLGHSVDALPQACALLYITRTMPVCESCLQRSGIVRTAKHIVKFLTRR